MQDWFNLTPNGSVRSWPCNGAAPSPYHRGPRAPLRDIYPQQGDPSMIKVDLAHTYAIQGFGKDDLASSLIFVAVRCAHFGRGTFPEQLELAYASFSAWCAANKKNTTIRSFDKTELKITSLLNLNWRVFFCDILSLSK